MWKYWGTPNDRFSHVQIAHQVSCMRCQTWIRVLWLLCCDLLISTGIVGRDGQWNWISTWCMAGWIRNAKKNMVSTFISVDVTSHNFGYPLTTGTAPPSREDTWRSDKIWYHWNNGQDPYPVVPSSKPRTTNIVQICLFWIIHVQSDGFNVVFSRVANSKHMTYIVWKQNHASVIKCASTDNQPSSCN
jgi:hypothetical protein